MLIDFPEREKEGERGRKLLVGRLSYVPWPGTNPATQAHTLTRNRACETHVALENIFSCVSPMHPRSLNSLKMLKLAIFSTNHEELSFVIKMPLFTRRDI